MTEQTSDIKAKVVSILSGEIIPEDPVVLYISKKASEYRSELEALAPQIEQLEASLQKARTRRIELSGGLRESISDLQKYLTNTK